MTIPSRLTDYLARHGTQYEVREHRHSGSSAETARRADIPAHKLAKSVIVEDESGCLMVVVPGDKAVALDRIAGLLGRSKLRLANEKRISALFEGCEAGAVPPVGMAWGIETIVDDELAVCDVVYAEAGDHEHVLCMPQRQFQELMKASRHGRFSRSS